MKLILLYNTCLSLLNNFPWRKVICLMDVCNFVFKKFLEQRLLEDNSN